MTDPAVRELQVIQILDAWDWRNGSCLIGGYAASAYGRPRYSRDLDFVVPSASRDRVLEQMEGMGFEFRPLRKPQRPDAFRDSRTLHRGDVSIDVMIGQVRDKETQVSVPGSWISAGSRDMRLILLSGSTQKPVRVCRPEALWALKLISGRDQDLGDLFAISTEPVDTREIRTLLAQVKNRALEDRFKDEEARLNTSKIFADSMSSRFLASSGDTARRSWDRFRRMFLEMVS